jgi:hypothetical protein
MHKNFLAQLVNEQIKVEINEEQQGKIKLIVTIYFYFTLGSSPRCEQQWKCRDSDSFWNSVTCPKVQ